MIEVGKNKFLKYLKKIKFVFTNLEFFKSMINGAKPIRIIRKYLKKFQMSNFQNYPEIVRILLTLILIMRMTYNKLHQNYL